LKDASIADLIIVFAIADKSILGVNVNNLICTAFAIYFAFATGLE
jgi:hypothetical protein